ncbi:MAG: hypothetical protein ABIS14_01260 [Sphingomonas sp.]
MKKVSSAAIVVALVLGLGGVGVAAPAFAKKEEAPKGPNLSPAVRTPAIAAQKALAATPRDLAGAEAALAQMDAAKKNDDEKYIADAIRLSIQNTKLGELPEAQRNYTDEAATLDSLIANPSTPKTDIGRFSYARAGLAYNVRQFDVASTMFARARDAGYQDPLLLINLAQAEMNTKNIAAGSADMTAAIKGEEAAGRKAPESWYRFMISRLYHANDADNTLVWTRAWLASYGTKENWRDAIIAFGFQGPGSKRLTDRNLVDLYRLMHATHSLGGQKEVLDYAAAALKIGLPGEAKAAIDEARTAGTIPAGNVTAADYYSQAKAGVAGDKGSSTAIGSGDLALGARDYAKAAEKYRLALTQGATDADTVNLHLGIALAMSGDKGGAQTAFGAVKSGANLDIAKLWTTYVLTPPTA